MLNPFVCGTFHHEEEDEAWDSSPRKFKRSKVSKNNNPYSTRGLDKFSALLADLNEKRQKIYSQMNPQEISFVRFVHSDTDEFVPVVVKLRNKDRKHKSEELKVRQHMPSAMDKTEIESAVAVEETKKPDLESDKKAEKKNFSWNIKRDMWRHPSYYLPVVMMLILVFLTLFGRSAATLCTCIVWYIVPAMKGSSRSRKSMKKKHYARGVSEKKMASDGLVSRGKHSHQNSW